MNAQMLIDSVSEPTNFLEMFYPHIYVQRQADVNITKVLKELQ